MDNETSHHVTLPLPPSVNRTLRVARVLGKLRMVGTGKAKEYRAAAHLVMKARRFRPLLSGDVGMRIDFYLPTKRSDVSNRLKALEDAITGYGYEDDQQVIAVSIFKHVDRKNPRAEVQLWKI